MTVLLIAPSPPPYGGMALQAQQLEALLRRDGVDVSIFPTNFALPAFIEQVPVVRTLFRAGLVWFKLWPRVRRADVVHVLAASWLYFFMAVYPSVLIGRGCRKRIVVNYRGGEAREFFQRYGWLATPAFRLASAVTAPSDFLAAAIRRRFGVPVAIVPNIIDGALFSCEPRTAIEPRFLVTRHLEKTYDVESVLKAFRVVQGRHPDASLWIAGKGSEEPRLRRLVVEWKLANVRFLGTVAHSELPAVCRQRDIYINASQVDNFPAALLEASAAGLVIVTTRAGGIPFIYEHGRSAWLVEPGDWENLAAGIEQVLSDPAEALEMTRAAFAAVRACAWAEVRKRLFEAYGVRAYPSHAGEGAAPTPAAHEAVGS